MTMHNYREDFSIKSSSDDIFKKAYHHSCRIRLLKIFLPLVALIIALVFSWFIFFSLYASSGNVVLKSEDDEIVKLIMVNPRLESYTNSHKLYWFEAQEVFQDSIRSEVIGLQGIIAEIPSGKLGPAFLQAQSGTYDHINNHLQLDKPFTIKTQDNMVAQFIAADIDLSEGQLKTDQYVHIKRAGLSLKANALQIREKGQKIYFQGDVHLVIDKQ
ncbi:LPS export ABC transporter periplasmic protein LptC [Bartonella sp. WD12.1]|uniref:LPS export ABC transporter periplasmic protein LptC n=1 Tax=Bartonella sp. WD12.1 TaxID=1933903 RepID=UPI0009993EA2|nr:LPS export ABC transporter periplasmic protein LptC [Bartonella sp. WD12.1]OPB30386.1 lipopolysaccharide export system protein LptC [Bartonella sp. WD12.1]